MNLNLSDCFFGSIALKNGVLTKRELGEALRVQQERSARLTAGAAAAGQAAGRGRSLGEICRELGFLREDEVNAILWAQAKSEVLLEDTLAGKIAVKNKLVTEAQLASALEEQKARGYAVRIGEILVERGIIDRQQLEAVLKAQRRLHESARLKRPTIEPPPARPAPAPAPAAEPAPAEVEAKAKAAARPKKAKRRPRR